jgi:phosphatidylglycerophosphate synthase
MARRLLALALVTSVVALLSLPLGATTTTEAGTETGTTEAGTTEATTPAVTIEPAVPVDTTPVPETNPDWTYRFFIPTLLVLAVLVVIVTVIQYFTRVVRNRYRIVR